MKKIVIINGHPDKGSFCNELANRYLKGAQESQANCELFHLGEMEFNPILMHGYRKRTDLEPDLIEAQDAILQADHLVFVYPNWWGTYPALLKGFIDRVFLPSFTFQYRENSIMWDKLLKGKSARLITTMDTPNWYYKLVYKSPGHRAIKHSTLKFCGVNPVRISSFSPIKTSTEKQRTQWLQKFMN